MTMFSKLNTALCVALAIFLLSSLTLGVHSSVSAQENDAKFYFPSAPTVKKEGAHLCRSIGGSLWLMPINKYYYNSITGPEGINLLTTTELITDYKDGYGFPDHGLVSCDEPKYKPFIRDNLLALSEDLAVEGDFCGKTPIIVEDVRLLQELDVDNAVAQKNTDYAFFLQDGSGWYNVGGNKLDETGANLYALKKLFQLQCGSIPDSVRYLRRTKFTMSRIKFLDINYYLSNGREMTRLSANGKPVEEYAYIEFYSGTYYPAKGYFLIHDDQEKYEFYKQSSLASAPGR